MRGLTDRVAGVFDRRLATNLDAPLAVALSGGGDSVALTLMADSWARAHGRQLLVLTVDHRLRAESAGWTETCRTLALRLGVDFRALAWDGEKPAHGLPAAARTARHGLLADAARAAGASVILMGHTADDLAESAAMRAEGASTPDAREWAPSPVWPQGRGIFLLRPLLAARRAGLRAWLEARGETWIEDPANADPRFARTRARATLAGVAPYGRPPAAPPLAGVADLARRVEDQGALALPRDALRKAAPEDARTLVATAALCAAGTARPPRGDRLARLTDALLGPAPLVATLAGARIEADATRIVWSRGAGEMARSGADALQLRPGAAAVWDGRYELHADAALQFSPLAGHARRMSAAARAALGRLPASARGGLPAIELEGRVMCPLLEAIEGVTVRPLALARLAAACGLVDREPV